MFESRGFEQPLIPTADSRELDMCGKPLLSGRVSNSSWGSNPAMGLPVMLRTLSMPDITLLSPCSHRPCTWRRAVHSQP